MALPLTRLHEVRFLRYLVASAGALVVDMGSFMLLLWTGLSPAFASALGYSLGIVTHWLLSSRAVFNETVAQRGMARTRQKALFVGSALAGLVLTTAIVGVGDALAFDPRLAKLVAIAASFVLTWLMRSQIVFRREMQP
jgi:putative flippase GtrA